MITDGKIKQVAPSHTQSFCYLLEIQLPHKDVNLELKSSEQQEGLVAVDEPASVKQIHFCSDLLNSLPQEVAYNFLQHMFFRRVKQGEKLIKQGDRESYFYLILQGSCSINVEKNNILYNVGQLGPGDIAGEMLLFIDEPQKVSVEAEIDTDVLGMSKKEFDSLSSESPDLRNFLSAVITYRLSTSKISDDRKIGKYRVTEKIGQGGSSIIYRGVHEMLNMPVAIKMLKHEMAMDPDFIEIFRNEAKIIAQLNHPNIVKVYDIEEIYQTVFIIMEYLEGIPLKNMLSTKNKLSISKIVDITLQVCYGLEYAHSHGIIHQDINPRNIFVHPDGQVKVIDFGLAIRRGGVDSNFLFPGTIYYIPPEQLRGDPVDERADIYSLGMTVYEMITGKRPFPSCHMKAIVDWHLNEDIPDTRKTIKDLPDELHNFLMKTIRKDPAERYRDITEAIQELSPLAEKTGVSAQPRVCKQNKMLGMFLVYHEDQQMDLKRFIEEFNKNVSGAGAILRITKFDDI